MQLDFIVWQENDADENAGVERAGAFLPRAYLPESRWRMDGYRRIAEANTRRRIWRNCGSNGATGMVPGRCRSNACCWPPKSKSPRRPARIRVVETQEEKLMLQQGQDYIMVSGKFPRLTTRDANF